MRDVIVGRLGPGSAEVLDPGTVEVWIGDKNNVPDILTAIERLTVQPDAVARVVVDEKSGTIVMGANVRIGQVAISQGGLTIRVQENYAVSQPNPLAIGGGAGIASGGGINIGGTTVVVPETEIDVREQERQFTILDGSVSLQDMVDGLNAIGVGARQTIAILQAIKAAGALHADLEVI